MSCDTMAQDEEFHITLSYDWDDLEPPAFQFMKKLNLPTVNPKCQTTTTTTPMPMNSNLDSNGNPYTVWSNDVIQDAYTIWCQATPALMAMSELWLRLFAFAISPLSICYLLMVELREISPSSSSSSGKNKKTKASYLDDEESMLTINNIISILGLASSCVVLNDYLYVHELGHWYGTSLFLTSSILSIRSLFRQYQRISIQQQQQQKKSASLSSKHKLRFIIPFTLFITIQSITIHCFLHSSRDTTNMYGHPGIDVPTISSGLYHSETNVMMKKIADRWPIHTRTYEMRLDGAMMSTSSSSSSTPYLPTGDSKTGIPFLVNKTPMVKGQYKRVFLETVDDEIVALDVAFPFVEMEDGMKKRTHSFEKPLYLVLHGLNGGSWEEYVRDFVMRRNEEGSTVVVMVARGLMDLPVAGPNVFHGARVTDVDKAAKTLRRTSGVLGKNQVLAGVGYSMGAIVLANYVARSGPKCHLHAAMSVSGGLDMREMLNNRRSMKLWQPMLAQELREKFLIGKFLGRYREKLSEEQFLELMRSSSISDIDLHAVVTYNNFDNLLHYYSEMSAMGDSNAFQFDQRLANNSSDVVVGRIAKVSIPFCILHALDDPLTTWRTVGHDPQGLANSGSGHVMLLLTQSGGHVGWPLGWNPKRERWRWMNDAVKGFVGSVDEVLMNKS